MHRILEYTNHLSNVLTVLSDKKLYNSTAQSYSAQVVSTSDYYPFGLSMYGKQYDSGRYRFGFNGKENDTEYGSSQLVQDYGFRIYNPAIAKFLSVDPLAPEYPMLTPYQFASNTPIQAIDLDGLEASSAIEFMKGFSQPAVETAGQITINISYLLEQILFKPAILPMIDPTGGDLVYPGLRDQGIQFSQTTYGQALSFYSEVIPELVSSGEYRNKVVDETGRSVGQFLSDLESGDPRAQGYAAGLIAEIAIGGGGGNASKQLSKAPSGVIDDAIEMAARARNQPYAVVEAGFNPLAFLKSLFGKDADQITQRMGRDGKAIEVTFKDGSKVDINKARVKEWEPNNHPKAPKGTLDKKKFSDFLPGSKGFKRKPTDDEIDFLDKYKDE